MSRKRASKEGDSPEEQSHPNKIFIGGLSYKSTTQHLKDHFAGYGAIIDAVVLRLPDGRSRGFGYVTFAEAAAACEVLRTPQVVGGREVDVKRAVPGTNKLFVGGLPHHTTASELQEHFEQFGAVSDAVVMMDATSGRSRGFGFVCFLPGKDGAAAVASSFDQYQSHRIRGKWIEIKNAAPPHKVATQEDGGGTKGVSGACDGSSTALSDDVDSLSTVSSVSGSCQSGHPAMCSEYTHSVSKNSCDRQPSNHVSKAVGLLGEPKKVTLGGTGARSNLDSPLKITPTMTEPAGWADNAWAANTGHMPWPVGMDHSPWPVGAGFAPWPAVPMAPYGASAWGPMPWQHQELSFPYPQWPGAGAGNANSGEAVQLLDQLLQQSLAGPVAREMQFQI